MLQLDLKKYKMDNGQDIIRINLMVDMNEYRRDGLRWDFIQYLRQKKSTEPTEPSECSTKG
jgi:hypothetical protein